MLANAPVAGRVSRRMIVGAGCRVPGAGCRVPGAGCRVPGAGCRVPGAGCRVPGAGGPVARRLTTSGWWWVVVLGLVGLLGVPEDGGSGGAAVDFHEAVRAFEGGEAGSPVHLVGVLGGEQEPGDACG